MKKSVVTVVLRLAVSGGFVGGIMPNLLTIENCFTFGRCVVVFAP
jgi:hypothetical protein